MKYSNLIDQLFWYLQLFLCNKLSGQQISCVYWMLYEYIREEYIHKDKINNLNQSHKSKVIFLESLYGSMDAYDEITEKEDYTTTSVDYNPSWINSKILFTEVQELYLKIFGSMPTVTDIKVS